MLEIDELGRFSEAPTKIYPGIAECLAELKGQINTYVYRPIHRTAIDRQ